MKREYCPMEAKSSRLPAFFTWPLQCVGFSALLLGGCMMGPDFAKPQYPEPPVWADKEAPAAPKMELLAGPAGSKPIAEPLDVAWWKQFNDPVLTSLVERAANKNLTVRAAALQLAESRAQRGIAGADQFPMLRGNTSYTRESPSKEGILSLIGFGSESGAGAAASGVGAGTTANGLGIGVLGIPAADIKPFNLWQYGLDMSWEMDLWGRIRRHVESADANVEAAADQARGLKVSILAEVARDYIELRRIQRTLALAREQLDAVRENVDLVSRRVASGILSEAVLAETKTVLADAEGPIPQLEQAEAQSINQLSLLLAEQPRSLRKELSTEKPVPPVPPRVPMGLPSELARRRPDIRRAEQQLHAATADIGVAVADFYPRLTLSGSYGMQALQFKNLGSWAAQQYALGPSVTVPIFQGGRLKSTLQLREAQQQQAAIAYHDTVLRAWHEVDNALTAYTDEQRRSDALARAVQSARDALDLAERRYKYGLTDLTAPLEARQRVLQAEQDHTNSVSVVAGNLVTLYKALGGGWEFDSEQTPSRRETKSEQTAEGDHGR